MTRTLSLFKLWHYLIALELFVFKLSVLFPCVFLAEAEAALVAGFKTAVSVRPGNADLTEADKKKFTTISTFDELFPETATKDSPRIKKAKPDLWHKKCCIKLYERRVRSKKTGKRRGIWMLTLGQFQVTPKPLYQNEASFRILRYFIELQNMKYFWSERIPVGLWKCGFLQLGRRGKQTVYFQSWTRGPPNVIQELKIRLVPSQYSQISCSG